MVVFLLRGKAASILKAVGQWGVDVKGGCEAAVHSARLALHQLGPLGTNTEDKCDGENAVSKNKPITLEPHLALPVDVSNAFCNLKRVPMFKAIIKNLPVIFELARLLYGQDTHLWFALDEPSLEPRPQSTPVENESDLSEAAAAVLMDIQTKYR